MEIGSVGESLFRSPISVRRAVLYKPAIKNPSIGLRLHTMPPIERFEALLEAGEVVKGNAGKVMVFEVIVGIEIDEIPEEIPFHQRRPLGDIVGIDVVMLADPVDGESNRKDEEIGDGVEFYVDP